MVVWISVMKELKKYNVSVNDALFVLTDEVYDEKSCLLAIESLLSCDKCSVNLNSEHGYNFIQNAIYDGYSSNFIIKLIGVSAKCGLEVNHQDSDGDTILHTAIYADDFKGDILAIYKELINNGFDSRIKDKTNRSIVEAMKYEKKVHNKFNDAEISEVEKLYNAEIKKINEKNLVNQN